jgi:four helix bundle suffix protein
LLHKQLKALGDDFLKHGGMRERMTRMRIEWRQK